MKKKSIIALLISALGFGLVATSCEDMLSPDSERHSYKVAQDTLYSYWGILKSMQNIGERYVILGECRGELVDGTGYITDSIKSILDYDMAAAIDGSNRYLRASDYYHVINSCNTYLAYCDTARETGTKQPYMKKEAAQVEAIRAWTYLQLVQVYGEVPFYLEPMTETDKINAFMNDKNKQMANADNLVDLLAPRLEKMLPVELQYGFPQYESYGYTTAVCHSTKQMIPLNLILGDLYLTKGDPASCEKAAGYYYNYLGNTQNTGHITPGGPLADGYQFIAYQTDRDDKPFYSHAGNNTPWTETGAVSKTRESITVIPSSTNKLWGTVLRGVNSVFGFDSEISVHTNANDTATTASINLTPQYDHKQLSASGAYFDLCNAQKYEVYVGTNDQDISSMRLTVDDRLGDARQFWVADVLQTYPNGLSSTEKFITKQNPQGRFTTVYPMIYRKSQVWLRFAEALNGCGLHSYAFAILKNGLCNNDLWYPTEEDYAVQDTAFTYSYQEEGLDTLTVYPAQGHVINHKADLIANLVNEGIVDSAEAVIEKNIEWTAVKRANWVDDQSKVVCNYLDWREVKQDKTFLNFNFASFDGEKNTVEAVWCTSLTDQPRTKSDKFQGTDDKITVGVHSRGCGQLITSERNSTYNYVDQVIAKAKENYGRTLTKEDIYNGTDDETVQKCVEDLIVDEEALELAFEGTRFFDLMRVAHRRNDPSYLAKRVARRNSALEGKLMNPKNWYFPLPQE